MQSIPINPAFTALTNAYYHADRHSFFNNIDKILKVLVIILGTGIAAESSSRVNIDGKWLELIIVITATFQLIADFKAKAKDHEFLQRQYFKLLSDIADKSVENHSIDNKFGVKLIELASEEATSMRAVHALAYNNALDSLESNESSRISRRRKITWWQVMLRNVCAFHTTTFPFEE